MRAPRRCSKKASPQSLSSSPSSAVLIRSRSTRLCAVTTDSKIHSAISPTTSMSTFEFHTPPASPPSSDHQYSVDGGASPLSEELHSATTTAPPAGRRRRKRVAIELPPDQASRLSVAELKKFKNRIAAARARERTQKQVDALEATVEQLWRENQRQQALIHQLRSAIYASQVGYALGAPGSAMAGGYQDMLASESSYLEPPFLASRGSCLSAQDASIDSVHDGMMAELSEMFPVSTPTYQSHGV